MNTFITNIDLTLNDGTTVPRGSTVQAHSITLNGCWIEYEGKSGRADCLDLTRADNIQATKK